MSKGAFVLIAPNSMAFRAIVNSDTLPILKQKCDAEGYSNIFVLSPDNGSQKNLPEYVIWRDFRFPSLNKQNLPLLQRLYRSIRIRLEDWLGFSFKNLAYRFNEIHGFYAHEFKKSFSADRKNREEIAGNFVKTYYGFPLAKSARLYKFINKIYYMKPFIVDANIHNFFLEEKIERLVFHYAQHSIFREYRHCAKKSKIPYVSIIGSWDRLTTKGPVCPDSKAYIVNTQVMADELVSLHGINKKHIHTVGWPQMDAYHDADLQLTKDDFCQKNHIDSQSHIIVFAGNSMRLGQHEPSIAEHICQKIKNGAYEQKVHLLIRPHPLDNSWQERFAEANQNDFVTLMPAEMQNLPNMINTLLHCDLVIATQGSITLDATAFNKQVINLNFDGDLKKSIKESVKRLYQMDHYRPIINTNAVRLVDSFADLDLAINHSLAEPNSLQAERELLKEIELEPCKGDSSARQVNAMLS